VRIDPALRQKTLIAIKGEPKAGSGNSVNVAVDDGVIPD
jgi:hypothetical protein